MTFEVTSNVALEFPRLYVELLAGDRCGFGFAPETVALQPASQALRFTVDHFTVGGREGETCAYPDEIASVTTELARASLETRGQVSARADFSLPYTFRGPPLSERATTPVVTELCWEIPGPSGGWCGDGPLPGDSADYRCQVEDDDGDAVSVTLSFRSVDGCATDEHCWSVSRTFEPRLTPLPIAIYANHVYPATRGVRLSCEAIDSRGQASVVESVCLGSC